MPGNVSLNTTLAPEVRSRNTQGFDKSLPGRFSWCFVPRCRSDAANYQEIGKRKILWHSGLLNTKGQGEKTFYHLLAITKFDFHRMEIHWSFDYLVVFWELKRWRKDAQKCKKTIKKRKVVVKSSAKVQTPSLMLVCTALSPNIPSIIPCPTLSD